MTSQVGFHVQRYQAKHRMLKNNSSSQNVLDLNFSHLLSKRLFVCYCQPKATNFRGIDEQRMLSPESLQDFSFNITNFKVFARLLLYTYTYILKLNSLRYQFSVSNKFRFFMHIPSTILSVRVYFLSSTAARSFCTLNSHFNCICILPPFLFVFHIYFFFHQNFFPLLGAPTSRTAVQIHCCGKL